MDTITMVSMMLFWDPRQKVNKSKGFQIQSKHLTFGIMSMELWMKAFAKGRDENVN